MCRAADELPILLPLAVFALYTVAGPMDAMAKTQPLKLSDLRPGTEYPMGNRLSDGRCLIHVKLTDPCVKSIESLINSDKVDCTAVQWPSQMMLVVITIYVNSGTVVH